MNHLANAHSSTSTKRSAAVRLRNGLRKALHWVPLGVYERAFARDVIGLCWHLVADGPAPHIGHVSSYKSPALFEADLIDLRRRYKVVSYQQLVERRSQRGKTGKPRPRRPEVVLTFDDGLSECYSVIRPLLLKYELPAIFFLTTGFIDNAQLFYRHKVSLCVEKIHSLPSEELEKLHVPDYCPDQKLHRGKPGFVKWLKSLTFFDESTIDEVGARLGLDWRQFLQDRRPYMTVSQIKSLADDGFCIGAHTHTHVRLSLLNERSLPTLEDEVAGSCRYIAEMMDVEQVPFAFPFSGDGVSRQRLDELRSEHPQVGLLFDRRGFQPDAPFIVNRIIADQPAATQRELWRRAYVDEAARLRRG